MAARHEAGHDEHEGVLARSVDQEHPAAGGGLPDLKRGLVFIGLVPAARCASIGELDNDDPLRLRFAFQQIHPAATHDKAAAEPRDAGRCERPVFFISGLIGDLDFGNDVSTMACSSAI